MVLLWYWLSIQTLVAHRNRNEDKLLHVGTNGWWRQEWKFLWAFRTPARLFSASRLFVLETTVEPRYDILTRDVFLRFAGFLSTDLFCIRTENGQTLLDNTEGNDCWTCEKTIGTLEEWRGFLCSSSKDFQCFKPSGLKVIEAMDPVFVQ